MSTANMKRNYNVHIDALTGHSYLVEEVNSPEEAEEVARQWFEDGEEGEIEDTEVYNIDVFPVPLEEELN